MRALIAICAAGALGGCATLGKTGDGAQNGAGVRLLLAKDQLVSLDVAQTVQSFVPAGGPPPDRETTPDRRLDAAVASFYSQVLPQKQALFRNEIQSRLMAAANQRCGLWKNKFASFSARFNFWSGSIATATSAAATAFTPEATKNALSAISTTATGAGAQYDKAFLMSQTISVILLGVDTRRESIKDRITAKSLHAGVGGVLVPAPIDEYPLSAAIADAIEYHSACTAASGLQKASESLSNERNDGGKADAAKPNAATPDTKPSNGATPGATKPGPTAPDPRSERPRTSTAAPV